MTATSGAFLAGKGSRSLAESSKMLQSFAAPATRSCVKDTQPSAWDKVPFLIFKGLVPKGALPVSP